jgi:predicted CDP-diglyceride synthetase/phosphatidate cytidylyltransferase
MSALPIEQSWPVFITVIFTVILALPLALVLVLFAFAQFLLLREADGVVL